MNNIYIKPHYISKKNPYKGYKIPLSNRRYQQLDWIVVHDGCHDVTQSNWTISLYAFILRKHMCGREAQDKYVFYVGLPTSPYPSLDMSLSLGKEFMLRTSFAVTPTNTDRLYEYIVLSKFEG